MMIKYKIVMSNNWVAQEDEITKLLNKGWQCQGGISVAFSEDMQGHYYYQAMIYMPKESA